MTLWKVTVVLNDSRIDRVGASAAVTPVRSIVRPSLTRDASVLLEEPAPVQGTLGLIDRVVEKRHRASVARDWPAVRRVTTNALLIALRFVPGLPICTQQNCSAG